MHVGISAIEYALPELRVSLAELEEAGELDTPAARLREFGFEFAHLSRQPADVLAARAVGRLMQHHPIPPESIDALFYAGALPQSHFVPGHKGGFLTGFNYPAGKLQYEFGLLNATVLGVSQVGCLGLMSAVKAAADFLAANADARRALCVSADVLPAGMKREIFYNVISDGACALLVEKDGPINRILAHRQITKGYYWDCIARKNEIVAAYFPTARHVVAQSLARAGLEPPQLAWILPHNVSQRSWEILLGLLSLPRDKFWPDNIALKGHVIAADNFINLKDASDCGAVQRGQKLLLFNFGFGANWSCLIVEH